MSLKIVPELLCSDIAATKAFYIGTLGFALSYERPEETFAYLSRDGADLMFEQLDGPGRRWITGPMEKPYGRGINFQIQVADARALHAQVQRVAPACIRLPLEEKSYRVGERLAVNRQFVIQDPDGYLLRFAEFV